MGPFWLEMLTGNVCVCDMNAGLCPQPRLRLGGWDLKCAKNVVDFQK